MWKRFKIYNSIVTVWFMFNVIFYIANRDYFNFIVQKNLAGYLFWSSLGLYLGFQWCKLEVTRVLKMQDLKESDKKMPSKHSPN